MSNNVIIIGGIENEQIHQLPEAILVITLSELVTPAFELYLTSKVYPHIKLHKWEDTGLITEDGFRIFLYMGYERVER